MSWSVQKWRRQQQRRAAREKEDAEYYDLAEIKKVLAMTDTDFYKNRILEIGAPEKILERLSVRSKGEWNKNMSEFRQCWIISMITIDSD